MHDIFISYSREDKLRVKPLADAIESLTGWKVWWDVRIKTGQTFDEVIEKALDEAACVVVVWSETSVKSHWVKTEAGEGRERGILVPVTIDAVKLPLAFRRIQSADLVTWDGDVSNDIFHTLLHDIAHTLNKPLPKLNLPKEVVQSELAGGVRDSGQTGGNVKTEFEPEMIRIPGGSFMMGSPENEKGRFDNEKSHEVTVGAFAIGQYPVTFAEYDYFCEQTGRDKPEDEGWGRKSRPVINVSWLDAYDYANWLAEMTGKKYRLASEAEWEYAARGNTQTAYWWGNSFDERNALYNGDKTAKVGSYKANTFGLYDMSGNVWEWTGSIFTEPYNGTELELATKDQGGRRVIRGGSWSNEPHFLVSANRDWVNPDWHDGNLGFRLAQD